MIGLAHRRRLNFIDNCLLVGFAVVRRDALLGRFLHARLFHRRRTHDLAFAVLDAVGWEVMAMQFGYIGLRLWEHFARAVLLMIGLLGAVNIPFYEEKARRIHW